MMGATHLTLLALAAAASSAGASESSSVKRQTGKYCPGGTAICFSETRIAAQDLTYRIAIPETAAAPFDILLQIVAPVSVGWAGLAWGGKMANNPLTVGWANGKTAVVSSRLATGHVFPAAYAGATYTVLPTTTTNATHWQLDVLCKGCSQWTGGSLNPNGAATLAWAKGSKAVTTPSSNASTFGYHDGRGTFSHDLSTAKIPQGIFDAVAYDLQNPLSPSSAAPSVVAPAPTTVVATPPTIPVVTTSALTLPAPSKLTSALTLLPPVSEVPPVSIPAAVSTRVVTLPAPITRSRISASSSSAVAVAPTPPVVPPPGRPSTTFIIISSKATTAKPTTVTVFPKPSKSTQTSWDIVTVTVTDEPDSEETDEPDPVVPTWAGGLPPWAGRGKGKGPPPWRGKGHW